MFTEALCVLAESNLRVYQGQIKRVGSPRSSMQEAEVPDLDVVSWMHLQNIELSEK